MKCELCKEEKLQSNDFCKEIAMFDGNEEKWSYRLCSKCSQMVDEYFSTKAYEGVNNLFKKEQEKKNV